MKRRWTVEKMETRTAVKAAKEYNDLHSVAVAALMKMTMINKILTQQKGLFSFTK
jgi:hypothetical protein